MASKKVLFVGDMGVPTGFGRVNDVLTRTLKEHKWEVSCIAINMNGDAHPVQKEFDIFPASLGGGDPVGIDRIRPLAEVLRPDLIVMHGDAWTVGAYLEQLAGLDPMPKLLGYVPPDSPNQAYGAKLNVLDMLLCPTQFGLDELRKGGFTGAGDVVPYGVDREIYKPYDRRTSRESLGFPEDAVIFGRADRNAKRKRYDDTVRIFAQFLEESGDTRSYLHLHCAPRDVGWDLPQLIDYYGLKNRVFFTSAELTPSKLVDQIILPHIFSSWDAHWSCTMGEGFGLIGLESAACGVGQILPRWSGYADWMKHGARFVNVDREMATDGAINTIGALTDEASAIQALREVVADPEGWRVQWGKKALDIASMPRYDWKNVAARFMGNIEAVMES